MRKFVTCFFHAVAAWALIYASSANAASCSATNDVGGSCSIDCPVGESAECTNSTGASTPECRCTGGGSPFRWGSWVLAPTATQPAMAPAPTSVVQTDVASVLTQRLATLKDYYLSDSCTNVKVGEECRGCDPCVLSTPAPGSRGPDSLLPARLCGPCLCRAITERRCSKVVGKLTLAGAIDVEEGPTVNFSEPNWKDIPVDFVGLKATYKWCNPKDTQEVFTHTVREEVGAKVSKNRVVNTGKEVTVNASVSYSPGGIGGIGGSIGGGVKFTNSISITSAEEQNYRKEETFTRSIPVPIPAMHETVYVHYWIKRTVPVKYRGTVQVNGSVAPNKEGIHRVSQVLTTPADRTFDFSGEVLDVSVYEGRAESYSRTLSEAECEMHTGAPQVTFDLIR
jgi:hypothetical protein